ncbi:MAG TPA: efflux RND transporter periplasmic adaptor subunit [Steroidobacteraceae bacterium]|nr:efflux RND transporter periplasmic adaptor subunit [Steroidobacteraceae bacterium]
MGTRPTRTALALAGLALLAACSPAPHGAAPPPPDVGVIRVHAQAVPLVRELVGRLSSVRTADVRARVPGILLKRLYREGSEVKAGQALFQIDPKPLQAALDAALAALAQAQATATNAHVTARRNRDLIPSGLISRSDVDNSNATERSTSAQVKQAEANVEAARINLGYATVVAPISGRSGQQRVTEGALVGQSEATLLTTIDQIDHLYVNFDRPADEILRLRGEAADGEVTLYDHDRARLIIVLPDGTTYEPEGTVDFSDVSVDPTNAALAFRGIIANPDRVLLPGMFVNVKLILGVRNHAFLIPQTAVRRDDAGAYVLAVQDGRVVQKRIQTDVADGPDWIVNGGLADGDEVIVTGVDLARPGSPVHAIAQADAAGAAASAPSAAEPAPSAPVPAPGAPAASAPAATAAGAR